MIKKIYLHLINILIINIIKILFFFKNKIRRIRKIEFEYFSGKYKLYSNKYFFILFGKDNYISRETYIKGPHDYDLLKKQLNINSIRVDKKDNEEEMLDIIKEISNIEKYNLNKTKRIFNKLFSVYAG